MAIWRRRRNLFGLLILESGRDSQVATSALEMELLWTHTAAGCPGTTVHTSI